MKTALITDWMVTKYGGAEKVNESICNLFQPDIFTLIFDKKMRENSLFSSLDVHTSFIQKLPFAKKKYPFYLPFFPLAIEQFNLKEYDLILSSSHCVAKGVLTHGEQLHICYCHTPIRYAWDLYHEYLYKQKISKGVKGFFAKIFLHYIRMWDKMSSTRVDVFIANSKYVARRIKKIYAQRAHVIYPPVDTSFYSLQTHKEEFFVVASRMVPYKKMDLIVEAFSYMPEYKLLVIGEGPQKNEIMKKAGKNITILGNVTNDELKMYLQNAKACIFAALEDFGILSVEAQSCGTAVIAFGKGGVRETVVENKTGIFFEKQSIESIVDAVHKFVRRQDKFDPHVIRSHAIQFDVSHFEKSYKKYVMEKYQEFTSSV